MDNEQLTPPPRLRIIEHSPTGVGIVFGRTATNEPVQAELQARFTAEAAARLGQPRLVVAAWGRSGIAQIDKRDDLLFLLDQASRPWCEWIAVSAYDRVARSTQTAEAFVDRLRAHNVEFQVVAGEAQAWVAADASCVLHMRKNRADEAPSDTIAEAIEANR